MSVKNKRFDRTIIGLANVWLDNVAAVVFSIEPKVVVVVKFANHV